MQEIKEQKHPFYEKATTTNNLPGTWPHALYHPPPIAVVFLPIWLSNLQRFVCCVIIKYFILNIIWFFVYYFSKKTIATLLATARCSALGRCGLLYGGVWMCLYLLLGLSPVVMKGYDFGQVGGNDGHAGVIHKFSRVAGAYPPPTM